MDRIHIRPQKIQICKDNIKTLNDLKILLGDINWIRPKIGIPTYALQQLFATLKGGSQSQESSHSKEALKEL